MIYKMVTVLLREDEEGVFLDCLPNGVLYSADAILEDDLGDKNAMQASGQAAGLAIHRAFIQRGGAA